MANELLVGIKIGATLSGAFQSAFSSSRSVLQQLGRTADDLRTRHARLGDTMARAMARPTRNIATLRTQYDQLGRTIEQVRVKQERLAASMARGESLKTSRAGLRSQAVETGATAAAIGAPIYKSVTIAAQFQDKLRDTAITGELSPAEEAGLGQTIRESALRWNQTQMEVSNGIGVLVAGNIQNAKELEAYAPIMAKMATATRASMDDLGSVAIALKNNLGVSASGFDGAMNMLAYAGKRGQFEIRDMAKWLPALTPAFQFLGVTGKEAVAEIGAALQIARKGAGSNDEAANNFKNFLQKLTSTDTLKDFEKAGINLTDSMMNLRAKGMTPVQSMLEIITQYMGSKGPQAAGQFQQAMNIKDDKEREMALQRLSEAYKLGELFQDMQAMAFIRPAIANMGEMKDIKAGSLEASDKKLIDQDWERRMDTATERYKQFKVGLSEVGLTVGEALLPVLQETLTAVTPVIHRFGEWAKQNPGLIKGVIGVVGGLFAGKLAFIGLAYGANLVLSPFVSVRTALLGLQARWTVLNAMWRAGSFAPAVRGLRSVGGALLSVGRFLVPFGKGLLMTFGGPLMLAAKGGLALGRILGGALLSGLRLAGQAVLWLGRALLMNPIGLAVMAIAGSAYLLYRYWTPIKAFFSDLWNQVKAAFNGGIGSIGKLILDWSPIGLFHKAFAGVMSWFGVDMPKSFTEFGGNLISGLVGGITSKLAAARDTIVSFGNDIKGWFSRTLNINSPSRVFMGYGDNIAQGAAIGITRSADLASDASADMARSTVAAANAGARDPSAVATRINAQRTTLADAAPAGGGAGGIQVTFAPVIQLAADKSADVRDQVQQALKIGMRELEQLMTRIQAQRDRRSYG